MDSAAADTGRFLPQTNARQGRRGKRYSVLILLVVGLILFALTPPLLKLGPSDTELWYVVAWFAVPLVAGALGLRTAAKCKGPARRAWCCFGLAGLLWMGGTVTWVGYGWAGAALPFPGLADAFYLACIVLTMVGMYQYSLEGSRGSWIQVTNFTLALCATLAVGFILYGPLLITSGIGRLGAVIVFSYPALGLSAWTFGLVCLTFYTRQDRVFPLLLILVATGALAIANFYYGFDILNGTYAVGTFYDVLWIAAFAFLGWAALEHRTEDDAADGQAKFASLATRPGEALIPGVAIAAILVAGLAARWPDLGPEHVFVVPTMFSFAALLAFREYELIRVERRLRQEAEHGARQLAESEKRLSGVLASTTDGVVVLDANWRVTFANKNASCLFAELRAGALLWEIFPDLVGTEGQQAYVQAMEQQTPVNFEVPFRNAWLEIHVFPAPDELSVFFRDVTEQRRVTEELVHLTLHDPLTGVANRRLFGERLASGLDCGRRRCDLTLVLIDIDDFKTVNDLRGHDVGDRLLKEVADRLTGLVRESDVVARLGGDEFAIILPGPAAPDGGAGIARRVSEALRAPFDIEISAFSIGFSIGIAMAPEHGSQPEELNRNADLALYRAKETKGTSLNYCVFEPTLARNFEARQPDRLELIRKSTLGARPDNSPADNPGLDSARFGIALDHVTQGLCMFDANKNLVLFNARFARMYGIPPEQLQPGTPFRQILQGRIDSGLCNIANPEGYLRERIQAAEEQTNTVISHHLTDGRTITITHSPLSDGGWVATHDDISDKVRLEAEIAHMAHFDDLTGLPNRILLRDELGKALHRGENLALLCLDLEQFKVANASFGHLLGDALLRQVAERLREVTQECDLVARLGGDAFAVVQGDAQYPEQADALARRIIAKVNHPYKVDGHQVIVGVSIGIAGAPTDSSDADALINMADMALYRCKREGRGGFRVFEPEMSAEIRARRGLERDLRKAFADNELEIHYQPIMDIEANRVSGFEALLRWNHAARGPVSPCEFVPLAEDIGLIGQIGAWVLDRACAEALNWPSDVRLAVNLSPAQFLRRDLRRDVVSALARSGLAANRLELEITETAILEDTDPTLETLHGLHDLGVHISLDDFGTGYSSLSLVRKFPFDRLKIDRSFVEDMDDDVGTLGIVRAVLSLGDSHGMAVTAEGVETMAQLGRLRAEGCLEAQGYFFSPARPASEIADLLTSVSGIRRLTNAV